MGRSRYKIFGNESELYYITCTTINWLSLFGFAAAADILLDSFRFLICENRIKLHGYVIMKDHLHFIASSQNLSKEVGDFKSYTARSIIDFFTAHEYKAILDQLEFFKKTHKINQRYQLWQEGSHPQKILTRDMLNQKLDYMHYNPVRKGYVEDPSFWRYSSYKDYHGGSGLLPIEIIGL